MALTFTSTRTSERSPAPAARFSLMAPVPSFSISAPYSRTSTPAPSGRAVSLVSSWIVRLMHAFQFSAVGCMGSSPGEHAGSPKGDGAGTGWWAVQGSNLRPCRVKLDRCDERAARLLQAGTRTPLHLFAASINSRSSRAASDAATARHAFAREATAPRSGRRDLAMLADPVRRIAAEEAVAAHPAVRHAARDPARPIAVAHGLRAAHGERLVLAGDPRPDAARWRRRRWWRGDQPGHAGPGVDDAGAAGPRGAARARGKRPRGLLQPLHHLRRRERRRDRQHQRDDAAHVRRGHAGPLVPGVAVGARRGGAGVERRQDAVVAVAARRRNGHLRTVVAVRRAAAAAV